MQNRNAWGLSERWSWLDERLAVGGQRSAVGGRRSAVSGQQSAVGGQRSAVSGQQSAVGGQFYEIGVIPVKSIDTTGAGDLYASGFLYGMVQGYSLDKCGRIGAILAGKVIEVIGPKLDADGWEEVKRLIAEV